MLLSFVLAFIWLFSATTAQPGPPVIQDHVIRDADFPGADAGARVNAAIDSLHGKPGTIWMTAGGFAAEQIRIPSNTTVHVAGVYTNLGMHALFRIDQGAHDIHVVGEPGNEIIDATWMPIVTGVHCWLWCRL